MRLLLLRTYDLERKREFVCVCVCALIFVHVIVCVCVYALGCAEKRIAWKCVLVTEEAKEHMLECKETTE